MFRVSLVLLGTVTLCWAGGDPESNMDLEKMKKLFPPTNPKDVAHPELSTCAGSPGNTTIDLEFDEGMIPSDIWDEIVEGMPERKGYKIADMKVVLKKSKVQPNITVPGHPWVRYYLERECPYRFLYVSSFYWARGNRWCYVPFPLMQPGAKFVWCLRRYCCNRINSRCFFSRFMTQEVFAYCPKPPKKGRRRRSFLRRNPRRFFRWIWLTLPQCCDCITCRDMRITTYEKSNNAIRFTDF